MSRALFAVLALAGLAAAQTEPPYRVDAAGGPAGLAEEVAAAFATWLEGEGLEPRAGPEAERVVRFGDPELYGPDTLSLTVQRGSVVEAWLHPGRYALTPAVLQHEVGALLGAPHAATGVMSPAVVEGAAEPSEADLAALREARRFAPEDVTRDGVVDLYDLAALGEAYGRRGVNLPADIDGDGVVGPRDLARLREAYRFVPPAEEPPATGTAGAAGAEDGEEPLPAEEPAPGADPAAEEAPADEPDAGSEGEPETP